MQIAHLCSPCHRSRSEFFFLQCLRDLSVKSFMVLSFCCVLVIGSKDWVCILETFNWCVCVLSSSGHKFLQNFHFPMYFLQDVCDWEMGGSWRKWFCALLKISNIPPRDFNYWRLELFLLVGKHFVNGWEVTTRQRNGAALC
jgi:hypothetical protein